ncbi:hypothetical protein [Streptomyces sp. NPDC057748]|uniref:hypothetical protein n=1 Tax=unclassified Streptomyces TaxID=2593676 RepID=UPI0036B079FD
MSKDKVLEAVDALAVELGVGKNGLAFSWDQLEALNGVMRAHAHELAEKILELRTTVPDLAARQPFKNGYDAALMMAALTIDPEATP